MKIIKINTDYIKLGQFLKLTGEADSGVHAKIMIQNEEVLVNGEIETRRGKKITDGDIISINNIEYQIHQSKL